MACALLAQPRRWMNADGSANERAGGDRPAALRAITARAFVMPYRHDLCFQPEESEIEVSHMSNAALQMVGSVWRHRGEAIRNLLTR